MKARIQNTREDKVFSGVIMALSLVALFVTLYPLYFVVIASFSEPGSVSAGHVLWKPYNPTLKAYRYILEDNRIWTGYLNTIIYTFGGSVIGLFSSLTAGYALSRKDLLGGKLIMKLFVFTMYFSGGLIPTYMVVNGLNLINTRLVMILMGSVGVYNIILCRTFFKTNLPEELFEAAEMDGCGVGRFFVAVALPLSKAIIAVIALYLVVGYWNSYFNALIYITKRDLFPLQLVIREILVLGQSLATVTDGSEIEALLEKQRLAEVLKYVVIIISSLPLIIVYPFLQKYFVQGVMVGSLKG